MRLCHGIHERNQHHFVIQDTTVVTNTLKSNSIRDTSFYDAITNIYDGLVLKIFINTIAKPHVKRSKVDSSSRRINIDQSINQIEVDDQIYVLHLRVIYPVKLSNKFVRFLSLHYSFTSFEQDKDKMAF